jgi:hypothetical protein
LSNYVCSNVPTLKTNEINSYQLSLQSCLCYSIFIKLNVTFLLLLLLLLHTQHTSRLILNFTNWKIYNFYKLYKFLFLMMHVFTMLWTVHNTTFPRLEICNHQCNCEHFFVNNQLDIQFFFMYVYFCSLHVSGSHVAIIGRINCINTTSGICHSVLLTVWCAGLDETHVWVSSKPAHQTVICIEWHIPDVISIQLILLMMGTWLPKTCTV